MNNQLNSKIWPLTAKQVDGVISIGGCSVVDLAREFGTPSFIVDQADFIARATNWRQSLE